MTIITTTNTDVKAGGGNHNHPGNNFYNQLVSTQRKSFVLAHNDVEAKNAIVQFIYESVKKQSPPGRFLEKNQNGLISIKSKKDACKKIKKALNENRAKIEEYFRLRGQLPPAKKTAIKKASNSALKKNSLQETQSLSHTSKTTSRNLLTTTTSTRYQPSSKVPMSSSHLLTLIPGTQKK